MTAELGNIQNMVAGNTHTNIFLIASTDAIDFNRNNGKTVIYMKHFSLPPLFC